MQLDEARALDPDSRGVYAGVQAAGDRLIARWESSATPAEIVRIDLNGTGMRAIAASDLKVARSLDPGDGGG